MNIHGATFEPQHDEARLLTQFDRVKSMMLRGGWHTLREIAMFTGASEAGASARLRDLRRPENGGYLVERRREGDPARGVWAYRVQPKMGQQDLAI